jgi:alpha-L-rhamnosidase
LQQRIIASFRREYVTSSGRLAGDTQTGYLLALAFDLLPVSLRPNAVKRLVQLIERNGDRLATGFVGTPLLCPVLSRFGRDDVAFRLLFQEGYPSWLYPIRNGATTMWERWNSWTRETGFGDVGMNSFNHYAYGAVGEWLYESVAGIAPDPRWPAFKLIRLRPALTARLTRVEARLESPYGEIRSTWRLHGSRLKWDLLIPPNTQAIACLPTHHTKGIRIDGKTPSRSILKRTATGCELTLPAGHYTVEFGDAQVATPR